MSEMGVDIYPESAEKKMVVGIVGMGIVGEAVFEGLQTKGHQVMVNDVRDIPYHIHTLDELAEECGVIFICVPTPKREDGSCDLSIVYEVFNQLHFRIAQLMKGDEYIPPVIAIKSTTIPGTVDSMSPMYPFVCSNPEFMTEKNALKDFLNPDRIIIGAKNRTVITKMKEVFSGFEAPVIITSPTEAEVIKYMSNSYLLTKVAFAQEISKVCQMLRIDAKTVYKGITADKRINPNHLDPTIGPVSLHTPCLSKDLLALIIQLEKSGYDSTFLKSAYVNAVDGTMLVPMLKIKEVIR